ncbi:hypothetical protein AB9F26_11520 [Falsihalocynthiibacter sp. BN13B15]|uniref:hypothetical protein n=1 Tax=Falsihalocynthiibacter sp. BN13B15 TaxID=3240871 RepID=UPI0035101A45
MTMNPKSALPLQSGMRVVITAFDDIPEHLFLVSELHEDCICGTALTGPFKGAYGEPDWNLILPALGFLVWTNCKTLTEPSTKSAPHFQSLNRGMGKSETRA